MVETLKDQPTYSFSELLHNPKIPAISKAILSLLKEHPEGLIKPQICFFLSICERTVERHIGDLSWKWKAVDYEHGGGGRGRHCIYKLTTGVQLHRAPARATWDVEPVEPKPRPALDGWSGVDRSVDKERLADRKAPTFKEAMKAAVEHLKKAQVSYEVSGGNLPRKPGRKLKSLNNVSHLISNLTMPTLESGKILSPIIGENATTYENPDLKSDSHVGVPTRNSTHVLGAEEHLLFSFLRSTPKKGSIRPAIYPFFFLRSTPKKGSIRPGICPFFFLRSTPKKGSIRPAIVVDFDFLLKKISLLDDCVHYTSEGSIYDKQSSKGNLLIREYIFLKEYNNIKKIKKSARTRVAKSGPIRRCKNDNQDQISTTTRASSRRSTRADSKLEQSSSNVSGHLGKSHDQRCGAVDRFGVRMGYPECVHPSRNCLPDSLLHMGSGPSNPEISARHVLVAPTRYDSGLCSRILGETVPRFAVGRKKDQLNNFRTFGLEDRYSRKREDVDPEYWMFDPRGSSSSGGGLCQGCSSAKKSRSILPTDQWYVPNQNVEDRREISSRMESHSRRAEANNDLGGDEKISSSSRNSDYQKCIERIQSNKEDHRTSKCSMGRLTAREKRIAKAREVALKKASGQKLTGRISPALGMAYAYERAFGEYIHKPGLKFIKNGRLDPENISSSYFEQAAELADSVGADYDEFVKAQFYWIHKWYGRVCYTHELRSRKGKYSAIGRWRSYKKLGSSQSVSSSVTHSVSVTEEELDKINRSRLEQLMNLWGLNEDQCLLTFVPEGIFDEQWLTTNSHYRKLKQNNKLCYRSVTDHKPL